jgi:DNA-binding helix-hairpin-helix protein with protein kinase domain
MPHYQTAQGASISLGNLIGVGGEGTIYDVVELPDMVAKIYHPQRLNTSLAAKVHAMVATPPNDTTRAAFRHVSIAWPEAVLLNETEFAGYLMPKIPKSDDLYILLQPQQRAKKYPTLNHRHFYRSARNLALAIDAIHQKGYVVGDVNFRNALFNERALITLVDCDSMQVVDADNVVHRCLVGISEYTAPELQKLNLAKINRTTNHDAFGLAILIFQLLMQGFHPFAGRPLPGAPDVEQIHVYCITNNICPYIKNPFFVPPIVAPSMSALPAVLQNMFSRAFLTINRPTPKEWADTLEMIESRLVHCTNDRDHWYPSDGTCVICEVNYNASTRLPSTATIQTAIAHSGAISTTNSPFLRHALVWTLVIVLILAIYLAFELTPTIDSDPIVVLNPTITVPITTPRPTARIVPTRTQAPDIIAQPIEPGPQLTIRKAYGTDTSDCVSMQIMGIDTYGFTLVPEVSNAISINFDDAGNARICGKWLIEKTVMMQVVDASGQLLAGGRVSAQGGDILMGVWKIP